MARNDQVSGQAAIEISIKKVLNNTYLNSLYGK